MNLIGITDPTKKWIERQIDKVFAQVSPKLSFKEELTLLVTRAALTKEVDAYDTYECDKIINNINQMVEKLAAKSK